MKPNLENHKKRHGTFFYPGSTGFKLNYSRDSFTTPRVSTSILLSLFMFMLGVAVHPAVGVVMGLLTFAFQMFFSTNMRILGNLPPTPEELQAKFKAEIETSMKKFKEEDAEYKSLKGLLTEVTSIKEALAKIKPEDAEASKAVSEKLRTDLDELGVKLKALAESASKETKFKKGSIAETLLAHKSKIDEFLAKGKGASLMIEHKATETSTDITGRDNYFTWHEGGSVGQIPVRRPFMRELFKNQQTSSEYIKYIDQETVVRDAKNVALCGTTTSNTKLTWKTYDLKVDKVRDFVDVCLDMMNDYSFVQGEIERLLNDSLNLKIDNDLLLGTGISPILHGLDEYASTFAAANADPTADYAASVVSPNLIDLVSIAGAQIRAFGKNNMWYPNYVLMNPRDVQSLKFLKDDVKNYIKNSQLFSSLFQDASGKYYIDGMLIVENPLVPQNEFYIGDFTKGTVYQRPGVGIEFAYENGTNFETETVTVKVYERLNLLVRNVDANAFMHVDDIEAALVAITAV